MNKPESLFKSQQRSSARRGIPFLLTFDEWFAIWTQSGHWHERGRSLGKYVMSRFGDIGPYAVGNVEIILGSANRSAGTKGKKLPPFSDEHRKNLSIAARARKRFPHSEETKRKMSLAGKGRVFSAEHRRRIAEAKRGSTPNLSKKVRKQRALLLIARNKTPEMRSKVSAGLKGSTHWKKRTRDAEGHFI